MSFFPGKDPQAGDAYACEAIAHVVVPRTVDLGDGFSVRRALPSARSRMVGPFIFFDHFGPAEFRAGNGLDVRPHPHIGLATVTYLFDGEIMHRDSLGTAVAIKPGEVNWMTAGRGIVHSERTGAEKRATGSADPWPADVGRAAGRQRGNGRRLRASRHGGIPDGARRRQIRARGGRLALRRDVAGADGARDDVRRRASERRRDAAARCRSRGARALCRSTARSILPATSSSPGRLLVFKPGDKVTITAATDAHFVIVGGAPMDGPRHIWWNFVSSRKERIEQAKAEWAAGHFGKVPGDEIEFIPLPEK